MLIDWFTVGAQVVNFLILVWLLKRFLYVPVLNAIKQRERRIGQQLGEARQTHAEAERIKADFEGRRDELEARREAFLTQAAEEARARRQAWLQKAREEADAMQRKLRDALREEQAGLREHLVRQVSEEIVALSRQMMHDLASQDLEGHIIETFFRRLQSLPPPERRTLREALQQAEGQYELRSGFELQTGQRQTLEHLLQTVADGPVHGRFIKDSEALLGIELTTGGFKTAWSVDYYLEQLLDKLDDWLGQEREAMYAPLKKSD